MILLMGFSLNGLAQNTGVNTKNPQGALHVDAKKNNATTGAPTGTQPDDDFIVASGNVGIGVLAPLTKLHLISGGTATTPISAIRIQDGSQGRNYVLLSDANGSAKWVNHPVMTANVVGDVIKGTRVLSDYVATGPGATPHYRETGFSITLSEGDWIVNTGLTFVQIGAGLAAGSTLTFWQRAYLSSSASTVAQVGFSHLGIAGANTCYGGPMHDHPDRGGNSIGFVTGSSIINVPPGATTKIYLLIENQPTGYYEYNSNYLETYFYATPIVKSP